MNMPLSDAYYAHTLTGKRIPHHLSPGPLVACRLCDTTRHGRDFVRVGSAVSCVACAAVRA